MENELVVTFAGGKKVNARIGDLEIRTDQSVKAGGEGSAPEPFLLFLASIGTCAGVYVQTFCEARGIPYQDIKLVQRMKAAPTGKIEKVTIEIVVPETIPEDTYPRIERVADLCAVKKTIMNPPMFEVKTVKADSRNSSAPTGEAS